MAAGAAGAALPLGHVELGRLEGGAEGLVVGDRRLRELADRARV